MTLKQHQNLVEITSLRCSKLKFDVVPTSSAHLGFSDQTEFEPLVRHVRRILDGRKKIDDKNPHRLHLYININQLCTVTQAFGPIKKMLKKLKRK